MNPDELPGDLPDEDPLEQLKKLKAKVVVPSDDPLEQLKRTKAAATPEVSDDSTMGYGERFATTLAQAAQVIPGMRNLEAGAAAVGSHLPRKLGGTGAPVSYSDALQGLDEQTEGMGKGRKFLAEAVASPMLAPVMASRALKALSLPTQGAVLGGASGAASGLDPGATLAGTAANTAAGAITGYAGGAVLKGAGNLATKTGLTDAVASGARRLGGAAKNVGEAIGTKGAANKVLQGRQDILDQLSGSENTAAQTMLDHVQNYKAQAKDYYDVARKDQRVLSSPDVRDAVSDPKIQQILQVIRSRLGTERATPALSSGESTGAPLQLERGGELSPTAPTVGPELPTPEELHLAKRTVQSIVTGQFNGGMHGGASPISVEEAVQLQPKLDALREALHTESPAWKTADDFYSQAKNFEDAYTKAYGAQQNPTAAALNPKKLKTPESIQAWAENAPTQRQLARQSGIQAGASGRIAKEVAAQPIGSNVADVLSAPSLQSSPAAATLRRPAFADDKASQAFADLLGKTGAEGAKDLKGPSSIGIGKYSISRSPAPNLLEKPAGIQLRAQIAEQLADPKRAPQIRAALMQSQSGRALLQLIQSSSVGALGAGTQVPAAYARDAVTRRLPQ